MKKFLLFLIFAGVAGFLFVGASGYDTFMCSNTTKKCFLRSVNPILKTQHDSTQIYLGPNRGTVVYRNGELQEVGSIEENLHERVYTHYDYVDCVKKTRMVKGNSGQKSKTNYLLVPFAKKHFAHNSDALKKYGSHSACLIDKEVLVHYLQSTRTDDANFRSAQSIINYSLYLLSALFALFAIVILFSKEISPAEAENVLTDEQKEAVYDKVKGYADVLNNLDSDTVKNLQNITNKIDKFGIKININKKQ